MTEKIETVIFENLIQNDEYTRKVLHFLEPDYFDERVDKFLIENIKKFYEKHNKCPNQKILKLAIEDSSELKGEEYKQALDVVNSFGEKEKNEDWLIQRTEKFCRDKSIYNAIMTSIGIIDGRNTKFNKEAIPGILQDALAISFDKTIGHDFFDNAEDRFKFYHLKEDRIPFDLDMFNKITKGGLPRKTLNAVLAGCVHPDTKVKIRIRKK